MITTRAMPAVHPSFLGVSHTITAAHNTHSRLCRSPEFPTYPRSSNNDSARRTLVKFTFVTGSCPSHGPAESPPRPVLGWHWTDCCSRPFESRSGSAREH